VYCPKHFESKFVNKCQDCGKVISGQYVKCGDGQLHPECWKCSNKTCKKLLDSTSYAKGSDDLFYCKECKGPKDEKSSSSGSVASAAAGLSKMAVKPSHNRAQSDLPCIFYSYDSLRDIHNIPAGVEQHRRELYLSDEDFTRMFGIDKLGFRELPEWKRQAQKKKTGLF
jgi:hypothetical protein